MTLCFLPVNMMAATEQEAVMVTEKLVTIDKRKKTLKINLHQSWF